MSLRRVALRRLPGSTTPRNQKKKKLNPNPSPRRKRQVKKSATKGSANRRRSASEEPEASEGTSSAPPAASPALLKRFWSVKPRPSPKKDASDPTTLSKEEIDALYCRFRKLDADGSGSLSPDEVRAALAATNLDDDAISRMIADADADGDGEIDREEFMTMMSRSADDGKAPSSVWSVLRTLPSHKLTGIERERLTARFNAADVDQSGSLDVDEVIACLRSTKLKEWEIRKLVQDGDTDGDGEIDLEEFVAMMESPAVGMVNTVLREFFVPDMKKGMWPGCPADVQAVRAAQREYEKTSTVLETEARKHRAERAKYG